MACVFFQKNQPYLKNHLSFSQLNEGIENDFDLTI